MTKDNLVNSAFWRQKLKEALTRAGNFKSIEITALLNRYDKLVVNNNPENVYVSMHSEFANECTDTALKEAKASLSDILADEFKKLNKQTVTTNNKSPLDAFYSKYGRGGNYEERRMEYLKTKHKMKNGLELQEAKASTPLKKFTGPLDIEVRWF